VSIWDKIFFNMNFTNISINELAANTNRFFVRFDDTYSLVELNFDDIDLNITFDYSLYVIPPILADVGSFEFSAYDASLNVIGQLLYVNHSMNIDLVNFLV
jgi:hypothetical protein